MGLERREDCAVPFTLRNLKEDLELVPGAGNA